MLFSEIPPHEQIYTEIMANYVKSTPVHNFTKVIQVDTRFRLYQILSLVRTVFSHRIRSRQNEDHSSYSSIIISTDEYLSGFYSERQDGGSVFHWRDCYGTVQLYKEFEDFFSQLIKIRALFQ